MKATIFTALLKDRVPSSSMPATVLPQLLKHSWVVKPSKNSSRFNLHQVETCFNRGTPIEDSSLATNPKVHSESQ